jgi:hypothetical protein
MRVVEAIQKKAEPYQIKKEGVYAMTAVFNSMKKKKNNIPENVLPLFEQILQTYKGEECDREFMKAMGEHLTQEQRFVLCEQNGSCSGTGQDKARKAFALEHEDMPLAERLELFKKTFNRGGELNADNTITVRFACRHGYYKHAPEGKFPFPEQVQIYFERCAGGRMYELEKALGIKLKIKAVDVSPLKENVSNPVVFTFEVI